MPYSTLIAADELAEHIDRCLVVDCRHDLTDPEAGRRGYDAAHLPGAVFVSMDVGKLFALDSVQIKLDDKVVANYLYTPREVEALHRGGVQRLYLGNLRAGEHSLVAFFTGKGPHERDYKRGATLKIDKGTDPKYIELQIKDAMGKLQPEFDVKVWQ
jgi:hypothetical protein